MLTFFPEKTGKLCSWISMAPPIGQIAGPPIGSLLFGLGGYYLPFWVVGLLQVVLALVGFLVIPEPTSRAEQQSFVFSDHQKKSFVEAVLKQKGILVLCFIAVVIFTAGSFFAVTFSVHLWEHFQIKSSQSGVYAFPIVLGRTTFSPLFGYLVDKGYPTFLFTIIGCFLTAVTYLVLFLAKFSKFLDSLVAFEGLFFLMGCTTSAAIVSFIPINRLLFKSAFGMATSSVDSVAASALYICFGSSMIAGMGIFGGFVIDLIGFEFACLTLAVSCFVVGLIGIVYFKKVGVFKVVEIMSRSELDIMAPLLESYR